MTKRPQFLGLILGLTLGGGTGVAALSVQEQDHERAREELARRLAEVMTTGPEIESAVQDLEQAIQQSSFAAQYRRAKDAKRRAHEITGALDQVAALVEMIRSADASDFQTLYQAVNEILRAMPLDAPVHTLAPEPMRPMPQYNDLAPERIAELLKAPIPLDVKRDLFVLWGRNAYLWRKLQ